MLLVSIGEKIFLLLVSLFTFLVQTKTRAGKIFPALVLGINLYFFLKGSVLSYLTYNLWKTNPISKFLLPPYNNFSYFLHYSFFHFFRQYFYSLILATAIFLVMKIANKLTNERLFEKNEPYLATLAILSTNWPINLIWLIFVITLGFLLQIYIFFIKKEKTRLSLYYLWIPIAILCIVFSKYILAFPLLKNFIL